MKGTVISEADVAVCDARVTAYFTGVEREEQRLKQDGVIPAQKGGTINIEHFIFTVKSKRNRRSWLVWKNVMDYLISKLDELKDKKIYDWSATDPVAAQTLMYVARLVPSAPSKEGARKRQILPSTNSVGTVRKNVSLRGLQ